MERKKEIKRDSSFVEKNKGASLRGHTTYLTPENANFRQKRKRRKKKILAGEIEGKTRGRVKNGDAE